METGYGAMPKKGKAQTGISISVIMGINIIYISAKRNRIQHLCFCMGSVLIKIRGRQF
jgi:hypothetical protein